MKTILEETTKKEVIERLNELNNNTKAEWGKMNCNEMLCHCNDQMKLSIGEIKSPPSDKVVLGKIMKTLVFLGMPAPKGKVETFKELKQGEGGTKPTTFENDRQKLIDSINNFDKVYPNKTKVMHPAFGNLTKKEWGKLIYVHLDHHIRQFGK